ncbi:hypothetical protein D3C73_1389080 [compost metagenome]
MLKEIRSLPGFVFAFISASRKLPVPLSLLLITTKVSANTLNAHKFRMNRRVNNVNFIEGKYSLAK